ncbi:MAG: hypothetical protein ACREFL_07005 [Stellaceae bacterium]
MVKIFDRDRRDAGPLEPAERAALAALFLLALGLRLVPTVFHPSLDHPDELFQSLEQAHRLVFGYGEIPWEFHVGTRSWLLPGALAGFLWLGDRIADTPALYLGAAHLALAALAATSVLCAFFWGRRWFGFWGGLAAAALPALWPDAIYFGARSLSECVAAALLVPALYLLDGEVKRATGGRRFAGGALLGLATALRIQVAPVLALALIWRAVDDLHRRASLKTELPFVIGIALALGAAGLLDALTWTYPFQTFWLNFSYNAIYGVADSFGASSWSFYLIGLAHHWGWFCPPIAALAVLGGWRLKLPLAAAVLILLAHSLVPHKEYRFIYPAVLLVLILAGVGLAQLASTLGAHSIPGVAIALLGGAAALSAVFAASAEMRPMWSTGHDLIEASAYVHGLDHVCGIGADGTYGGYAYFHRDVPFYWVTNAVELADDEPGFDVLMTTAAPPQGFETLRCFGNICVARRTGTCLPIPPRPFMTTPHAP